MRALLAGRWRHDLLDAERPEGALRVDVFTSCKVGEAIPVRPELPSSLARLLGYVRKVGARRVVQKIASRRTEQGAIARYCCVGVGRVIEASEADASLLGELVIFVATRHYAAQDRVVVHASMCRTWQDAPATLLLEKHVLTFEASGESARALSPLAGWSPRSGEVLDAAVIDAALDQGRALLERFARGARAGRAFETGRAEIARTRGPRALLGGGAVVFGWGHYARTCIAPVVSQRFPIIAIHEIDPALIPEHADQTRWSTSSSPDEDDHLAAAWFVAGYHHTHARIACEALERRVPVVIEKPLLTSPAQLERLLAQRAAAPDVPLFIGFHRRHATFDAWLRQDLSIDDEGAPVDCHAIVHEIPLPRHHWYNWPVSGSRLISNGCHWIDHFLWLNAGAEVGEYDVWRGPRGQLDVRVVLENGACMTLALSDLGSSRTGVREVTEWRARGRTARLIDQAYSSEDGERVLRRGVLDEAQTYARMYGAFCEAIEAGESGESYAEIERVWRLILALEARLSGA